MNIETLLQEMTLDEKLGQMQQLHGTGAEQERAIRAGAVGSLLNVVGADATNRYQKLAVEESRLGIPLLFGRDVIHGFRTILPIPLGQAATFDPELVRAGARVAAREAAAAGVHWTFAPMVDISRDPRWGRIAESCGEDPLLAGRMGAAMVEGFQGESLADPESLAACAKHYVGYGAAEGGRDYNTTCIPEGLLRDVYLPPFRACCDAGAATIMSAFNELNGIPTSGNELTLRRILKGEWAFAGFVVSDWMSVTEMIAHGFAADAREAARAAIRAGVDMEMVSTAYRESVEALLETGELSLDLVDDAVRRILAIKQACGLFDRPYVEEQRTRVFACADHLEVAKQSALASCVLLENDGVLPLAPALERLAVIGPLADAPADQLGCWIMDQDLGAGITPLAALRAAFPGEILHAPGLARPRDTGAEGFSAAVQAARQAEVAILFLGEDAVLSGEAHSRAFLDLPGAQLELLRAVAATGTPVVAVILAGRPLVLAEVQPHAQAILYAWHPGTMGGPALADLLLGRAEPAGRLPVSFPAAVGQIPVYYNHKNTGRPAPENARGIPPGTPLDPQGYVSTYLDCDPVPLYPFGCGLGYTTFAYGEVTLSAAEMPANGALTAAVEVRNTGVRAGVEVAQLYVRDCAGSCTRPVRELKDFQRVSLAPGEAKAVRFTLRAEQLAFHNPQMARVVEAGEFLLGIGGSSRCELSARFSVVAKQG